MDSRGDHSGTGRRVRPGHVLLLFPLALIVVVVVVDVHTPTTIHLGPLLAAAPALAASFARVRGTACIAALAVVAQIVIAHLHGGLWTANHQAQIAALLVIGVLVVAFRAIREQREGELRKARSVARLAQQALVQPLPERVGPLRVAELYEAAEAEAHVGGDLYAVARSGRRSRLLIGDVRGKGMGAIGEAAQLTGAFRALASGRSELRSLASVLDQAVAASADISPGDGDVPGEGGHAEGFITAVILEIDDDGTAARLVNCGHPPPLLLRDGTVTEVGAAAEPALPLGLNSRFQQWVGFYSFEFRPGDLLLLHTDGASEARNAAGTFYPLSDRVLAWSGVPPEDFLRYLHRDLTRYAGGALTDDLALIALERAPADEAAGSDANSGPVRDDGSGSNSSSGPGPGSDGEAPPPSPAW